MGNKNTQLMYNISSDLILQVRVIDGRNRKLFKDACNILNKKDLARIFNILEHKFGITVPKDLKEDTGWFLG